MPGKKLNDEKNHDLQLKYGSKTQNIARRREVDKRNLYGEKASTTSEKGQTKKSKGFVPLYSEEGQQKLEMRIPGRHECYCQAARHKLINNCLGCGRIVCDQEGSGPCLYCGQPVCTVEEENILRQGGKKGEELKTRLFGEIFSAEFNDELSLASLGQEIEQVIDAKNRLLQYDRNSAARTTVIDDERDYFAANSPWLTTEERRKLQEHYEKLRGQRFQLRSQQPTTVTLDFAGRRVVEDERNSQGAGMYDKDPEAILFQKRSKTDAIIQPVDFVQQFATTYSYSLEDEPSSGPVVPPHQLEKRKHERIQDSSLQELVDKGICLSVRQPYASLIVHGIKKHEGRTWYTNHRGRLWIASGAKEPQSEEVQGAERSYRLICKEKNVSFPPFYPTGCLLGCAAVIDCLPQEQYLEAFPNGECDAPYVWILDDARFLTTRFPVQGRQGLYELDEKIHQSAKKLIG